MYDFFVEFMKRCGYDFMLLFVIVMGVLVDSVDFSECVLFDLCWMIVDFVFDNFYGEMVWFVYDYGCFFFGEVVNFIFFVDGFDYGVYVDILMGEFWLWML